MAERDWYDWHAPYGDPSSVLSLRLSWVRARIRAALDETPPGPIRLISMCAGQGHRVAGQQMSCRGTAECPAADYQRAAGRGL